MVAEKKAKEMVQVDPPALAGRRERIKDFRQFIEANRKDKDVSQIVAVYALESGVSVRTIEGYMKLLYQANVYVRPRQYLKNMLYTPQEYEIVSKEYERKQEEERKQLEKQREQAFSELEFPEF